MNALDVIDGITWALLFVLGAMLLLIGWTLWREERRRERRFSAGRYLGMRLRLPGYRGVYTVVSVDTRRREFFLDRRPEPDEEGQTTQPNGGV